MTRFMDWCPFVWAAGRAETKAARDSTVLRGDFLPCLMLRDASPSKQPSAGTVNGQYLFESLSDDLFAALF